MINTVLQADPTLDDAKKELAAIYEILGETRKALDLVLQGSTDISTNVS